MNASGWVEAALFVSDGPVPLRRLARTLGLSDTETGAALGRLAEALDDPERGLELAQEAGGYILRVKPDVADLVRPLAPHQDIPEPVLRTLAVVAFQGPILQSEVIRLRGQRAYGHVKELIERGFLHAQEEGPTKRLSVSDTFLRYFRINSPDELRPPESPSATPEHSAGTDQGIP